MFEVIYVKDIGSWATMVLQNYQNFIAMTSNMIYIVAFGGGFKCPSKIHSNTQCPHWIFRPTYGSAVLLDTA